MKKPSYIPDFIRTRILCREQSEILASEFVDTYNKGRKYGERVITSQMHTINQIITDLWEKLTHRLIQGKRLYITVGNLAKLCKCSVKTAYNHLNRLIEAGILRKAHTTHKFKETDRWFTPCLLLEINPKILHFQVINTPEIEDNYVDKAQLVIPEISEEGKAILRQLGIFGDSD